MGRFNLILVFSLSLNLCLIPYLTLAQLSTNHYAKTCPNVESIVRTAVQNKFKQTFVTVPATLRLFFHDCFVQVINLLFNCITLITKLNVIYKDVTYIKFIKKSTFILFYYRVVMLQFW